MQLSRLGWRVLVFIFPFFSLDWDFWKLLLLLSETSLFLVSLFPLARYYGRESFSQRNCSAFSMKMKKSFLVEGQAQEKAAKVMVRWSKGMRSHTHQRRFVLSIAAIENTNPFQTHTCLTKERCGIFWHPLGLICSMDGTPCGMMPTGLVPAQAMAHSTPLLA